MFLRIPDFRLTPCEKLVNKYLYSGIENQYRLGRPLIFERLLFPPSTAKL